jgi:electron transport complex protein RnfD
MLSFSQHLGAPAYEVPGLGGIVSMATPLTLARDASASLPGLGALTVGTVNGSIGEVSVLACVLGGLFLCLRGTASWVIPLAMLGGVLVPAALTQLLASDQSVAALPVLRLTLLEHLTSGALMFGAFFVATDPVTSPITRRGEAIFGAGVGLLVWVFRTFSSYPEGVMFAVLLMNGVVPLINRWTVPIPFGDRRAPAPLAQDKSRS